MKTKKVIIPVVIGLAAILSVSAMRATEAVEQAKETETAENPCGVGAAEVTAYLQNCSHHHTVYYVNQITGTCNFTAGIENCGTATVYVQDGIITTHADQNGICE
jgi:hypothetical protein